MKIGISKFQTVVKKIALADCGQSMTEYALMCALVAFGATAGYHNLAKEVANAFDTISSDLATSLNLGSGDHPGHHHF
jgi:Flp pilus assembly pilin Flp